MMPPRSTGRSTWASTDDNGGFYLIIVAVCACAAAYLLWDNYHGTISRVVMDVFHQEIALLRHLTDRYDLADRQMMRANPERVTLRDLYGISRDVGMSVRIPASLLMLVLAACCMVRAAPSRFRRAFDLDGLIREQAASFHATAAFVRRRLGLIAPAQPDPRPADYALTAEEWITRCASDKAGAFSEALARDHLARQLGPRWRGLDQATPQVRCLFAACALHLAERRADAITLVGDMSASLSGKSEPNPDGPAAPLTLPASTRAVVDRVLSDYAVTAPALSCMGQHAWTHTALMGLLTEARASAGVLAPAQFAWLKLVDRPLWYALHSLGFETEGSDRYVHPNPRVEAAGARDHWTYERLAGGPVIEPNVDRAMDALRRLSAAPGVKPPDRSVGDAPVRRPPDHSED